MSTDIGPGVIDDQGVVILDQTGDISDEAAELFVRSDPFVNLPPMGRFTVDRRTTNGDGDSVIFWSVRPIEGFEHRGVYVTDPTLDETGRFPVGPDYYGKAVAS